MKKLAGYGAIFLAGALTTQLIHAITDPREALMQADRDFDKATAARRWRLGVVLCRGR